MPEYLKYLHIRISDYRIFVKISKDAKLVLMLKPESGKEFQSVNDFLATPSDIDQKRWQRLDWSQMPPESHAIEGMETNSIQ